LQLQKLFAHSRAPWPSSSRHKHPLSLHHQDRSGIGWWDKITETSSSPSPSPARLDTLLPSYHPTIRAQGALGSLFKHFKHISSPLRETDWGDHRHFTFAENLGHDITRSATRQADRPNITRSLTIISRARKPHNTTPVRQGPKSRLTTFELKFWQLFDTYTILQSNTAEAQRSAQIPSELTSPNDAVPPLSSTPNNLQNSFSLFNTITNTQQHPTHPSAIAPQPHHLFTDFDR
jgi:hypothetical protein